MSEPRITYAPRPDAPAEAQVAALSNVYRFILDCHSWKRGRLLDNGGPDDAKESDVSRHEHHSR